MQLEFWWPWPDQPVPGDHDVDRFITAVQDAGVSLIGLNFFAGDLAGPDCGCFRSPTEQASSSTTSMSQWGLGSALVFAHSMPSTGTGCRTRPRKNRTSSGSNS